MLIEKYCENCNKLIFPSPMWVYKKTENQKTYWYCSWSCYNSRNVNKKRVYRKRGM